MQKKMVPPPKPLRIFRNLEKVVKCDTRIQLSEKTARPLLEMEYIKEVPFQEDWGRGIFTCVFHKITEKGQEFYDNYLKKKDKK